MNEVTQGTQIAWGSLGLRSWLVPLLSTGFPPRVTAPGSVPIVSCKGKNILHEQRSFGLIWGGIPSRFPVILLFGE